MSEPDPNATTSPSPDSDWPAKLTDTVVGYVNQVRLATTGQALVASRGAVYFLAIGLIGIVFVVLALIFLLRFLVSLTSKLPFIDTGEVWLSYFIYAFIFLAAGSYLWGKKDA